jgi:hypothetical protein
MPKTFDASRRKRNKQNNGSVRCQLPFNISDNLMFEFVVNLVDYVGVGKYTCCGEVAGIARQSDYPEPCLLRFPTIYTGRQSLDDLRADLNKVAEKQGFQFTVRNTKHRARATEWTLSCTRHRMAEHKVCKHVYDYPDAQFVTGMKVTTVKENRRAEKRGPTDIHQTRKTETSLPTSKEDICPFKINIRFNKKNDLFYLSKNGSVDTHSGHVQRTVIFARADQIDKNMQHMIKDFEVANIKPSTASRLLHQMEDHVYDPKAISNVIAKAQKTWLSDRGINTRAASAQVLLDYITVSPDTSCVFLLHDPETPLTGGAKKGRQKNFSNEGGDKRFQ